MQNGSPATKAKNKYKSRAYDRIEFFVPKGFKGLLQETADSAGESMNGYVNQAVLAKLGLAEWPQEVAEAPPPVPGMAVESDGGSGQSDVLASFAIDIMERLNGNVDLLRPVSDVLESVRMFFSFGCAFVYQADHKGIFTLSEHTEAYEQTHLQDKISLQDVLGEALLAELATRKVVIFPSDQPLGALERALEELFDARSIILIPIMDQQDRVMALVGLVDRRGMQRHREVNMDFAYAMLASVANHIKLRMFQVRIESTQKSLESILDHMGVDIYVNDFNTHEVLYANKSMGEPYGGKEELVGDICWKALYKDKTGQCDFCPQMKLLDEKGQPTKAYSWDYQRPFDGSWFRVLSAAFQWVDGRLAHVVSSVDITENKNNEELIRQLAEYDALTELPNRRKLMDDLAAITRECEQGGEGGYLLFFDLDGFKKINDTLGHQAGDELLHAIGQFLAMEPLFKGRSYRHSGDEFVIIAPDRFSDVKAIVERLLTRFSIPWRVFAGDVVCNTSIGVARFPEEGTNPEVLLNQSDKAMYDAKRAGKGQAKFIRNSQCCSQEVYEAGLL